MLLARASCPPASSVLLPIFESTRFLALTPPSPVVAKRFVINGWRYRGTGLGPRGLRRGRRRRGFVSKQRHRRNTNQLTSDVTAAPPCSANTIPSESFNSFQCSFGRWEFTGRSRNPVKSCSSSSAKASSTMSSPANESGKGRKRKNNDYDDEELASYQGQPKRSRGGARGQKEAPKRCQEEECILDRQKEQEALMRRQEEKRTLARQEAAEKRRKRARILARRKRLEQRLEFESLQQNVTDMHRENVMLKALVRNRFHPDDADEILEQCEANEEIPRIVRDLLHVSHSSHNPIPNDQIDIIDSLDAAATAAAAASVFDAVFDDFDFETNTLDAAATAAAAASVFDAVFDDFDFETNILEE